MLGLAVWYVGTTLRGCYIGSLWSSPKVPKAVYEKPEFLHSPPTDARPHGDILDPRLSRGPHHPPPAVSTSQLPENFQFTAPR